MLLEGCQGKKDPQIEELICPHCGAEVELMSYDVFTECPECGETVFSQHMLCILNCPQAEECIGTDNYRRMMNARELWRAQLEKLQDDDLW